MLAAVCHVPTVVAAPDNCLIRIVGLPSAQKSLGTGWVGWRETSHGLGTASAIDTPQTKNLDLAALPHSAFLTTSREILLSAICHLPSVAEWRVLVRPETARSTYCHRRQKYLLRWRNKSLFIHGLSFCPYDRQVELEKLHIELSCQDRSLRGMCVVVPSWRKSKLMAGGN